MTMGKSSGSDRGNRQKKYSPPADFQNRLSEYNSLNNRYTDFRETERKMQLEIYFLLEKIKEYRSMGFGLKQLKDALGKRKNDLQRYRADIAAIK